MEFDPQNQLTERRAGITRIRGHFSTVLAILDMIQDQKPKPIVLDHLQLMFPEAREQSIKRYLGIVKNELGLLDEVNGVLYMNETGRTVYKTKNPDAMKFRLLHEVKGFDLILLLLLRDGLMSRNEMVHMLQMYHPSWKTNIMPNSLIAWSVSFGLIFKDENTNGYYLTSLGESWGEWLCETVDDSVKKQIDLFIEPTPFRFFSDEEELEEDFSHPLIPTRTSLVRKERFPERIRDGLPFSWKKGELTKTSFPQIESFFAKLPYHFSEELLREFYVGLHMHSHKRFVLLSGLSGTGKSILAREFANAYHGISSDEKNPYFHLVAVQPDWLDATPLLGYINPLSQQSTYMKTPFLQFLFSALEQPEKAHFLCLDEMNLARPEYYFAPFLTAMESRIELNLHQGDESVVGIPSSVPWPSNLFIIGTVNMDETTHAFSDKLLDRAMTLEFWDVDLLKYKERLQLAGTPEWQQIDPHTCDLVIEALQKVIETLYEIRQHFGYRTAEEIIRFVHEYRQLLDSSEALPTQALDRAITMKVLPKLRGENMEEVAAAFEQFAQVLEELSCTVSADRVKQMGEQLRRTGTTRFWRA